MVNGTPKKRHTYMDPSWVFGKSTGDHVLSNINYSAGSRRDLPDDLNHGDDQERYEHAIRYGGFHCHGDPPK